MPSKVVAGGTSITLPGGELRLTSDGVPRAPGLAMVTVMPWAALGFGVGTLISHQVLAVMLVVGPAWIVEPLLAPGSKHPTQAVVTKYLPSHATAAVIAPPTSAEGFKSGYLPGWAGCWCSSGTRSPRQ